MTLIAQISDPHLRVDGAYPCHDAVQALRRAFSMIETMDVRPDAMILTGDIIDRSATDYAHVLPLLGEAPMRLLGVAGTGKRTRCTVARMG